MNPSTGGFLGRCWRLPPGYMNYNKSYVAALVHALQTRLYIDSRASLGSDISIHVRVHDLLVYRHWLAPC